MGQFVLQCRGDNRSVKLLDTESKLLYTLPDSMVFMDKKNLGESLREVDLKKCEWQVVKCGGDYRFDKKYREFAKINKDVKMRLYFRSNRGYLTDMYNEKHHIEDVKLLQRLAESLQEELYIAV